MRMLIVEDDELLRKQLVSLFIAEKWAVEQAADGDEGLFLGSEHPYDAVIVDLGLPGLAGIELIHKMKRGQAYGFTSPLITTSSGEKMGKTAGGAVWLDAERTSPYEYYQYWINTEDADVERFLAMFTFLPMERVREFGVMMAIFYAFAGRVGSGCSTDTSTATVSLMLRLDTSDSIRKGRPLGNDWDASLNGPKRRLRG